MKHCDACTVDFTGDMARCPLCQNELRGEASPAAFPAQQIYLRPRRLAVEIITFVTGAILLLHGFFSYLFSWPIPIASASAAALIISVLFINSAILHVPRPLRLMFRYFYIMLAIALVWFVATMNHVVTCSSYRSRVWFRWSLTWCCLSCCGPRPLTSTPSIWRSTSSLV